MGSIFVNLSLVKVADVVNIELFFDSLIYYDLMILIK